MKTFAIHTLGCKVNQYESRQIRQLLERFGLSQAAARQKPHLVIVNTCCVTHKASAKSRQAIRQAQHTSPNAAVIVTGCLPAGPDNELKNLSNILIVKDKNNLPAILDRLFREQPPDLPVQTGSKPLNTDKIKDKNDYLAHMSLHLSEKPAQNTASAAFLPTLPPLEQFSGHCRAFLKVQGGCDAYCTYCIIPKIRKNVCNKPVKSVLEEAKRLIDAGHKEIVLTGICLGAYGQTTARRRKWDPAEYDALPELVDAVAGLNGLKRLRLSSLGPLDVTNKLLAVMTAHHNIMPHLHLSLQSGSDNVLRKMARRYRVADFLQVTEHFKTAFDRPAVTTDIIVGFPGETEADFDQTVRIAEQVGFAKIHVFPFSPRKNTAAVKLARLFSRVDAKEMKRRAAVLHALDKRLQQNFRRACRGLKENVLIETTRPPAGRTTRYFMMDLSKHPHAKNLKPGDILDVIME